MSKPWILVTPASRGLGAAVARHALLTTTLPVVATCRTAGAAEEATRAALLGGGVGAGMGTDADRKAEAEAEARGSRLTVVPLDVTDEASVAAAAARAAALFPPAAGWRLHLGLALPGVLHPEKSPGQVRYDAALETLRVNTLGPLVLMKWFGDLLPTKGAPAPAVVDVEKSSSSSSSSSFRLPAHATWLTASARVGSTADNRLGGWYSYRASKAGVASLTKTFDLHLRQRCGDRALAVAYHPGTVRTDLSRAFWANVREDKLFSPEYAAERLFEVVGGRTLADRGRVWDWKGEEVPP